MFGAKLVDAQHRIEFGGADRDRTGGLLVANQALSQLSYVPIDERHAVDGRGSSLRGRATSAIQNSEADAVWLA